MRLSTIKLVPLTFIVILLFPFLPRAQYVTIPDANFAQYLNTAFPSCMSGSQLDTSCAEVWNAKGIYISNKSITDLQGLRYFKNLDTLVADQNPFSSIPSLPASLKMLKLAYNYNLTSLPLLPQGLTYLKSNNGALSSLPTLPNGLRYLDVGYNNHYLDIPSFPTGLTYIDISGNKQSTVPPIPAQVTELHCSFNTITALPPLPAPLVYLDCDYNALTALPAMPPHLRSLVCAQNNISNIPALPHSLYQLVCDANKITHLPALPDSLLYLTCSGNLLTSLPPLPAGLVRLICADNKITALGPLSPNLRDFNCSYNPLTELPAIPSSLDGFDCSHTLISTIPALNRNAMGSIVVNYCPNLSCLPKLPATMSNFYYDSTALTCLPNRPNVTASAIPPINTLPLCDGSNGNGCSIEWNIGGVVFIGSCTYTAGTNKIISPAKMRLYKDNQLQEIAYCNGAYSFKTDTGSYAVEVDTVNFPYTVTCNPFQKPVNISKPDTLVNNVNFGMKCKDGFDIGCWDVHQNHPLFPGQLSREYVSVGDRVKQYYNTSCNTTNVSGQVKILIQGPVSFMAAAPGALTPVVSGDTLIYDIADFSLTDAFNSFVFDIKASTGATIGDQACLTVIVTPVSGDNTPANNLLTHCFPVTNSYDPNIKEVSPVGSVKYPFTDWLTYTIHFQNTGNAAARNITLLDTLDSNIDPSTFELLSYTTLPATKIAGQEVSFSFKNIFLPDSASDEENSKAFVSYRVKPYADRIIGTQIHNSASIYFDFNAPIRTNTTTTLISDVATTVQELNDKNLEVDIYPNPAGSQVFVSTNHIQPEGINMYDVNGRLILWQKNAQQIDISRLDTGIYFVQVIAGNNVVVKKLVKI